jgi:hypothetical protein
MYLLGWMFFQSLISTQSRLVITSSEGSPSTDSVLSSDSICVEVPTDDIRVGDSVLVLPGETIPIDVSLSDCLWNSVYVNLGLNFKGIWSTYSGPKSSISDHNISIGLENSDAIVYTLNMRHAFTI